MEYRLRSQCDGNCGRIKNIGKRDGRHAHSHGHGHSQNNEESDDEYESVFTKRYVLRDVDEVVQRPGTSAAVGTKEEIKPKVQLVKDALWKKLLSASIWIIPLIIASIVAASQSQEALRAVGSYVSPVTSMDVVNRTLHITQIRRIYNYFSPVLPVTTPSDQGLTDETVERFHKNLADIQRRLASMEGTVEKLSDNKQEYELEKEIEQLRAKYKALMTKVDGLTESDMVFPDVGADSDITRLKEDLSGFQQMIVDISGKQNDWNSKIERIMAENDKVQRELGEIHARVQSLVKADCQTCASVPVTSEAMTLKDVNAIINTAIAKYDADKTGLPDFALESGGGSIVGVRCTATFTPSTRQETVFGIPLFYKEYSPRTVIQPGFAPGECWAFKGSYGYLVIRLSGTIEVTGISYEHISKDISPTGNIDSAPKNFEIHALANEKEEEGLRLGKFIYDAEGPPLQYFPVQVVDAPATNLIEFRVLSNYGHPVYTCLYRLRVHGRRVEPTYGTVN